MKSAAVVAALLMSLSVVQGCGTLGHPAAGTDTGASRAITLSTLEDGSTRIVVSTDAAFD